MLLRAPMKVDKCSCPRGEEGIWDAYVQTYRENGKPYRGIFECPKISRWHCMVLEWAFLWCGYRVLVRQRQESLFFSTLTELARDWSLLPNRVGYVFPLHGLFINNTWSL